MKIKELTMKDQVLESLLFFIEYGMPEGSNKLPSERVLSEKFNVSRSTIRSTLEELKRRDLIYSIEKKGYYVKDSKIRVNLLDLRSTTQYVKESGKSLSTKVLKAELIEANLELSRKFEVTLGTLLMELHRVRYVDGEPYSIEKSIIHKDKVEQLMDYDFSTQSLYGALQDDFNVNFDYGNETIEAEKISDEDAVNLELNVGQVILKATADIYTDDDRLLEHIQTFIREDRIRYYITIKNYLKQRDVFQYEK